MIDKIERYINDLPRFTKKNTPEHTAEFLKRLGNPQDKMKVIHVAGTNGKGSVTAYINAMLIAEGLTVGMFISPHLVDINERIVINGENISDSYFEQAFNKVIKTVHVMLDEGYPHPAYFEFLYGIGMCALYDAGVEFAVVETGLGGRLDATNQVKHPIATVITNIGYDHMYVLGNTIEEIAKEKAGIIKEGIPVFYSDSDDRSNKVIEEKALEKKSPCKKIKNDDFTIIGIKDKHIAFSRTSVYDESKVWKLNNIGSYQPLNASLAIAVMEWIFKEKGQYSKWHKALEEVKWPGRMEEVSNGVYVDGAHNIDAVIGFTDTVKMINTKNIILFSAVDDKDYDNMISYLCSNLNSDMYIITKIDDKRGTDTKVLKATFEKYTNRPIVVKDNIDDAIEYIKKVRDGRDVFCLGSLYLAGMIKRRIL